MSTPVPSLRVDLASPVPPYEQLRAQIADLITLGTLPADTRLPPVRQLAADLGLASGTVARVYRELEQAGLVEGRGRHGTIVQPSNEENQGRHQELTTIANRMARATRRLGISDEAALAALRTALATPPDQ